MSEKKAAGKLGNRKLTEEQWGVVRMLVCSGQPVAEVARKYRISPLTIYGRSNRDQWPTEKRVEMAERQAERTQKDESPANPDQSTKDSAPNPDQSTKDSATNPDQSTKDSGLIDPKAFAGLTDRLLTASRESAEAFQTAVGDLMEFQLAAGLPHIPPPRTISEAAKYVAIIRQTKGLDKTGQTAGGLFDPVAPVRRGRVVDAEETARPSQGQPDPLDGFEP